MLRSSRIAHLELTGSMLANGLSITEFREILRRLPPDSKIIDIFRFDNKDCAVLRIESTAFREVKQLEVIPLIKVNFDSKGHILGITMHTDEQSNQPLLLKDKSIWDKEDE